MLTIFIVTRTFAKCNDINFWGNTPQRESNSTDRHIQHNININYCIQILWIKSSSNSIVQNQVITHENQSNYNSIIITGEIVMYCTEIKFIILLTVLPNNCYNQQQGNGKYNYDDYQSLMQNESS